MCVFHYFVEKKVFAEFDNWVSNLTFLAKTHKNAFCFRQFVCFCVGSFIFASICLSLV